MNSSQALYTRDLHVLPSDGMCGFQIPEHSHLSLQNPVSPSIFCVHVRYVSTSTKIVCSFESVIGRNNQMGAPLAPLVPLYAQARYFLSDDDRLLIH